MFPYESLHPLCISAQGLSSTENMPKPMAKSRENCQTSEPETEMQRSQRPEFMFIRIAQQHAHQAPTQLHPRASPGQTIAGYLYNGGTCNRETGDPGRRREDVSGRRKDQAGEGLCSWVTQERGALSVSDGGADRRAWRTGSRAAWRQRNREV